jgi:hypothetical protein
MSPPSKLKVRDVVTHRRSGGLGVVKETHPGYHGYAISRINWVVYPRHSHSHWQLQDQLEKLGEVEDAGAA